MYKIIALLLSAFLVGYFFIGMQSKNEDPSYELAFDSDSIKTWKKFEPISGKFSIMFPSIPQHAIDEVNVPKTNIKRQYEIFVAEELDGTVYMINLITYPPGFNLSNPQELLHNVIKESIANNVNNHIIEIKDSKQDDRDIVSFHAENNDFQIKGESFLIGSTVYLLSYTATKDLFNDEEYKHFAASLIINEDEKKEQSI